MRKKNWVEFSNDDYYEDSSKDSLPLFELSKLKVHKEKKGKKGKIITVVSGLNIENYLGKKELLKKLKVFCSTGGTLNDGFIYLQGDMVSKVKDFFNKEKSEI